MTVGLSAVTDIAVWCHLRGDGADYGGRWRWRGYVIYTHSVHTHTHTHTHTSRTATLHFSPPLFSVGAKKIKVPVWP